MSNNIEENGVVAQCNIIHFEVQGCRIKRSLNLYNYCTAYCIAQKWMQKVKNVKSHVLIYDFPIDLEYEVISGKITTYDGKNYPLVWCVSQDLENVNEDTFCLLGRNTCDSKLLIHYTLYEIKDNGYFLSNFQFTPVEIILATLTSQYSIPFDNFEFEALFHNVDQSLTNKISKCLYSDEEVIVSDSDVSVSDEQVNLPDPNILFCRECKGFYEQGKPKNCDCYCEYEN